MNERELLQEKLDEMIRLLKLNITQRPNIDQSYVVSSSQGFILDFKDRKHLYAYAPNTIVLSLNDIGSITITANTWTDISFRQGMQVFSTSSTPQLLYVRATDDSISGASSGGNGPGASIGANGSAIPTFSTLVGGSDGTDLRPLSTDTSGNLNVNVQPGGAIGISSLPSLPAGNNNIGNVTVLSFPATAGTPLTASATGASGASGAATLAGAANKTTYITGFTVIAGAVSAEVEGVVTITGLVTGTLSYRLVETVAAGGVINVQFSMPVPASAVNTAIAINVPTIASGGSWSAVATGFQQ